MSALLRRESDYKEGLQNKAASRRPLKGKAGGWSGPEACALPEEVKVQNFSDLEAEADFPRFQV